MAKEVVISKNEREFILAALGEGLRIDGRTPLDYRNLKINFYDQLGTVEVQLGRSRAIACVTAEAVAPYETRPNEGFLNFHVDFSPMASPAFEEGRPSDKASELSRVVDRGIRDSGAIDVEALCILAGERVWNIRVDIHVLDHEGNIIDCCGLAALVSLLHFRRPDTTVVGDRITIHSEEDKQPIPIALHHKPVPITFALFEGGDTFVIDPVLKEELTCEGLVTMTMNSHQEICAIQKPGGVATTVDNIMKMTVCAAKQARDLISVIERCLKEDAMKPKRRVVESEQKRQVDIFGTTKDKKMQEPTPTISKDRVNDLEKKLEELRNEDGVLDEVARPVGKNLFEGGSLWAEKATEGAQTQRLMES